MKIRFERLAASVEAVRSRPADPLLLSEASATAVELAGLARSAGLEGVAERAEGIVEALQPPADFNVIYSHLAALYSDLMPRGRGRVLLVEDDLELQELLRAELEGMKLEVVSAGSLAELRSLDLSGPISLAVVDGLLPDGDALGVIAALRERGVDAKVLVVTAFSALARQVSSRAEELGVVRVLRKPLVLGAFVTEVMDTFGTVPEPVPVDTPGVSYGHRDPVMAADAALRDVLVAHLHELPDRVEAISEIAASCCRTGDAARWKALRHATHSLRGTSGTLGLMEVADVAGQIEDLAVAALDGNVPANSVVEAAVAALAGRAHDVLRGGQEEVDLAVASVLLVCGLDERAAGVARYLQAAGLQVVRARSVAEGVQKALSRPLDGVILDLVGLGGLRLGEVVLELRRAAGRPGLRFATIGRVMGEMLEAAGISTAIAEPISETELGALAWRFSEDHVARQTSVLVVDDDLEVLRWTQRTLASAGFRVTTLNDPLRTLEVMAQVEPQLVIIDAAMPVISGFEVCRSIRETWRWRETPVLFVGPHGAAEVRAAAFVSGADDYALKPVVPVELVSRARRLAQPRGHARDELTGLLRPLGFLASLDQRQRAGGQGALIVFDIEERAEDLDPRIAEAAVARAGDRLLHLLRAEDLAGLAGGRRIAVFVADASVPTARRVAAFLSDSLASEGRPARWSVASVPVSVEPGAALRDACRALRGE